MFHFFLVFKLFPIERKFFNLLKVSTFKFEKVCGIEFFSLLKVLTLKIEVCGREVLQVVKSFNIKV
jgi:hypothetical protein